MRHSKVKHSNSKKDTNNKKKISRIEKSTIYIDKTNIDKLENKSKKNKITLFFIIFFSIIIVFSSVEIILWIINNKANQDILDEIEDNDYITYDEDDNIKVDFDKLKEMNSDVVGYIEVNNTNIEYPVVQTTNNTYYLTYNLKKEYNKAGWIFMDYRNNLDGTDKNIVIYGHNRKDGSMFSSLNNILNADWYENAENKYVTFITEQETSLYEVFSVYQIEEEDYYIQTDFADETAYENFLKIVTERSIYNFNVDLTANDQILTLSTCANSNKYRVVLHAKKN